MFKLITSVHEKQILSIIEKFESTSISNLANSLDILINQIRSDIPEKKKISYGRYTIIKKLGIFIYPLLSDKNIDIKDFVYTIFNNTEHDEFVRSLSVQILSVYGNETGNLDDSLKLFEKASCDDSWEVRECSQGFVRKLVKNHPDKIHKWYLKMVTSKNPMQRRFASESLRPVADNKWFRNKPEFAFSIIENLYKEPEQYPRSSIGNSLSDWMRVDETSTFEIVKKLAINGDKNSYWIAYRACRNYVKKEPIIVMNLLKTDKYTYKSKTYFRKDY